MRRRSFKLSKGFRRARRLGVPHRSGEHPERGVRSSVLPLGVRFVGDARAPEDCLEFPAHPLASALYSCEETGADGPTRMLPGAGPFTSPA